METPPKKTANERKMLADYSQDDTDQFRANLPHAALEANLDNEKSLVIITKGPRPGKCWSLAPIENNACIDMMLEGPNDFKLLVPLNNINFENEDCIFPFSIGKSKRDKMKSFEDVYISFHCQNSGIEVGGFDVDIASLSTIEDVEQFEPLEDHPVRQPYEKSRSVVEADMADITHNPLSVDVNEIVELQSDREYSISESSSLSLPDDVPCTMNFLSMIDMVEDITPGVLGEMSSDEDTDAI